MINGDNNSCDALPSFQNLKIVVIFLFIAVVESPLENANKKGKKKTTTTHKRGHKDVHL